MSFFKIILILALNLSFPVFHFIKPSITLSSLCSSCSSSIPATATLTNPTAALMTSLASSLNRSTTTSRIFPTRPRVTSHSLLSKTILLSPITAADLMWGVFAPSAAMMIWKKSVMSSLLSLILTRHSYALSLTPLLESFRQSRTSPQTSGMNFLSSSLSSLRLSTTIDRHLILSHLEATSEVIMVSVIRTLTSERSLTFPMRSRTERILKHRLPHVPVLMTFLTVLYTSW
mmetsp:Transcript_6482/g.13012  ORF Transcript_6482/g.13012 Transcript_6482/m.13012 type:complete len:231 (-) Transcript_6482:1951-2643(-)